MKTTIKQSDNICTVGWRNIWGNFTVEQITVLYNAFSEHRCSMISTQYTERFDINHPDRLVEYINYRNKNNLWVMPKWGFYFDYPAEYHDKVWSIINNWFPLMDKSPAK